MKINCDFEVANERPRKIIASDEKTITKLRLGCRPYSVRNPVAAINYYYNAACEPTGKTFCAIFKDMAKMGPPKNKIEFQNPDCRLQKQRSWPVFVTRISAVSPGETEETAVGTCRNVCKALSSGDKSGRRGAPSPIRNLAEKSQTEYEKLTAEELMQIAYSRDSALRSGCCPKYKVLAA
ncbi:hypothetical protein LSTR_LSTR015625 [Laodelphax striatellus]|uniref:Uncharacterized protein n=1 Tax=Laodelphax striatellus TaxID=195883 RepID=A0A482WRT1_LAOST|nr:hypothetical protein LSTR_LSTR015625 [Laodelphax striatellus]